MTSVKPEGPIKPERPMKPTPLHARLNEELPVDHRLSRVYRIGAGLMGLVLLAFGIFGLIDRIGIFDTGGDTVAAISTPTARSASSPFVWDCCSSAGCWWAATRRPP